MMDQWKRAITEGVLSIAPEDVRDALIKAYHQMSIANSAIAGAEAAPVGAAGGHGYAQNKAMTHVKSGAPLIQTALTTLLALLGKEN
jgi:hypothetical protein